MKTNASDERDAEKTRTHFSAAFIEIQLISVSVPNTFYHIHNPSVTVSLNGNCLSAAHRSLCSSFINELIILISRNVDGGKNRNAYSAPFIDRDNDVHVPPRSGAARDDFPRRPRLKMENAHSIFNIPPSAVAQTLTTCILMPSQITDSNSLRYHYQWRTP